MTKGLIGLAVLLVLTGCSTLPKVTPLQDQSASQIEADRARCTRWAQKTANVDVGYAACMITAGYEAEPGVVSTSQRVRLVRKPTANDPIGVLIDLVDCDSAARREAESGFGIVRRTLRDSFGWRFGTAERSRQLCVECLKPRGYAIASPGGA